jgi:hypothetical protein
MNKKYAVILSTVMLGLICVGVVYAHWTDQLYVDVNIDTGRLHLTPIKWWWSNPYGEMVDVYFDDHSTEEMWDDDLEIWVEKEWRIPEGYVTVCEAENSIFLELLNVYPCLNASIFVELFNDGTIPAGYNGAYLDYFLVNGTENYEYIMADYDMDLSDGYGKMKVYNSSGPMEWPVCELEIILTADEATEPWSDVAPNSWAQIDPGYSVYARINIHFNEELPQNTTFEFYFRLFYVNWNEVGVENDLSIGAPAI